MGNVPAAKFSTHFTVQIKCCEVVATSVEVKRNINTGHQIWDYAAEEMEVYCKKCFKHYTYNKNTKALLEVEVYVVKPQVKETPGKTNK